MSKWNIDPAKARSIIIIDDEGSVMLVKLDQENIPKVLEYIEELVETAN